MLIYKGGGAINIMNIKWGEAINVVKFPMPLIYCDKLAVIFFAKSLIWDCNSNIK